MLKYFLVAISFLFTSSIHAQDAFDKQLATEAVTQEQSPSDEVAAPENASEEVGVQEAPVNDAAAQENISTESASEEPASTEVAPKETSSNVDFPTNEEIEKNMEEIISGWTLEDVQKAHENGFNFNTKDARGNTPLYYALSRDLPIDVIKKIIEYGADVNEPAGNGMIPLNVPTSKANELQLQILMFKTMGLDMSDPKVEEELEKKVFYEMSRMVEIAAVLIDAGADINKESVLGTPLMNAATNRWNEEIINLLIKYKADVNKTDKNGRTALFYAFASSNDDIVSLLIQAGADTNIKDKDGHTYMEIERTDSK